MNDLEIVANVIAAYRSEQITLERETKHTNDNYFMHGYTLGVIEDLAITLADELATNTTAPRIFDKAGFLRHCGLHVEEAA